MMIDGKYYADWKEVMEFLTEIMRLSRDGQQRYKNFDEITRVCAEFLAEQYKKAMSL